MVEVHTPVISDDDARWVIDAHGETILEDLQRRVQQDSDLLEKSGGIVELAWRIDNELPRPELLYDPATTSRALIPRIPFPERMRSFFARIQEVINPSKR